MVWFPVWADRRTVDASNELLRGPLDMDLFEHGGFYDKLHEKLHTKPTVDDPPLSGAESVATTG